MRQFRLSIVVGVALVALCGIALFSAVVDYTSHPEVANAHVPPVGGTPAPGPSGGPGVAGPVAAAPAASGQAPGPAPTEPIVTAPVDTQPGPPAVEPVNPVAEPGQGDEDGNGSAQRSEGHGHHGPHHSG